MGIFYSISVNDQAQQSRKNIKKIITDNKEESVTKILFKNSSTIFFISDINEQVFEKIVDEINDQKINYKIITDFDIPETNIINCNKINEVTPLPSLKECIRNEISLDKDISYNGVVFHEEDIKIVEFLLKALFYNLYDDKLNYDKAFLHAMSYVSSKTLYTQSRNKSSLNDRLVYSCLKNWYEKYYIYKKSLYNSYYEYFEYIRHILENDNYLLNTELHKSYPLSKKYYYYIENYIRDINNIPYGKKSYKQYLVNELIFTYKIPSYDKTDCDKLLKLANQLIYDSKKILSIVNYWVILYNIQKLEKTETINNIIIYTRQRFDKHLLFALEDMGFSYCL